MDHYKVYVVAATSWKILTYAETSVIKNLASPVYGIPEANILGRIPGREKKFRAAGEKAIMDGETIMEGDEAKAIMEGNGNEAFMEDDGDNVVMEEDGDKTVMEGDRDKTAMEGNEGDTRSWRT